jgi:hypothetical protein
VSRKKIELRSSARPTTPVTASVWIGCTANRKVEMEATLAFEVETEATLAFEEENDLVAFEVVKDERKRW